MEQADGYDDIRPWDHQAGEGDAAYEAFVIYRDLGGKRNLRRVAAELDKSTTLIGRWSKDHDWVRRAAAWDSLPGRKMEEAIEDRALRIAEQHDRLATKLLDRLERNLDTLPEGADPSIKWSTAHGAARQGHQLAIDVSKNQDAARDAIRAKIESLIDRLAGDE